MSEKPTGKADHADTSEDIRGASRSQAIGCFKPPFRYQSGYVFDANNCMVADMPGSAVCRVRGWGRLQYRTDCDPEALQDMVGILIAEALTRFWENADSLDLDLARVRDAAHVRLAGAAGDHERGGGA